ncbi:hypothetical protein [Nostoc sp. UHCC 0251]|uniref:hypothetical protein n=1 Tax=Nostoc sp. UHCC 0251 TaxID=3110240 RepID=UPI002B1EA92C|nr:hypothetical protein [Nostoc sp. UHCC 0251]MEA5626817.1 hypothetical protein [Nostoc sp. UHCC 0251]
MTTPIPYYISRKQAHDFLAKFAKALGTPESTPLLFQSQSVKTTEMSEAAIYAVMTRIMLRCLAV